MFGTCYDILEDLKNKCIFSKTQKLKMMFTHPREFHSDNKALDTTIMAIKIRPEVNF